MEHPAAVRLPRYWYVVCLSSELGRRPLARTVGGVPVVVFRDGAGNAGVLLDRCPHRNAPLSAGRLVEGFLRCAYHGWRFDAAGGCREIPGLCTDAGRAPRSRSATAFAVAERDGFVWMWPEAGGEPVGEPYRFPHVDDPGYSTVRRAVTLEATLHAALENTLDVPHTAFLHGGLFRGRRDPVEIEVIVRPAPDGVEAEYVGEPRPPGVAGRLLAPGGGVVSHVDRFLLPSIAQVEYRLEDNHLLITSAYTPVSDIVTRLQAAVSFSLRMPHALVRALLPPIARVIIGQDARMLARQAATIARFGGEQFTSTELDVLGQHILRLLHRAERGEAPDGAVPEERRIRMRV